MQNLEKSIEVWNLWPKHEDPRSLVYFQQWYKCTENLPQVRDVVSLWLDICAIYENENSSRKHEKKIE